MFMNCTAGEKRKGYFEELCILVGGAVSGTLVREKPQEVRDLQFMTRSKAKVSM